MKNSYRLTNSYKICLTAVITFICALPSSAQIGGTSTYDFLDLSPSSRITALGGLQVCYQDEDNSSAFDNPALLSPQMNDRVSLNTVSYLAGINYGNASYAHTFDSIGTFHAGIQYINYGDFDATDVTGASLGTFRAAEYALYVGCARTYLKNFSYGVNVKLIYSDLDSYTSSGIAADFGGSYNDTAHLFNAGIVFRNVGTQLQTYTGTHEPLPFEIDFGVSKALAHFPLRIFITLQHLETFKIKYDDTTSSESNIFGDTTSTKTGNTLFDNIFSHVIIGGELTLGKHILIEGSYNDLRRQELAFEGKMGLAGYSIGVGIKINRFSISYSHAVYDVAGGSDNFSLNIAVAGLFKKKQIQPAS